jgi:hypothetical protein
LKLSAYPTAPHPLDQVKEVHVTPLGIIKNLHLQLSDDLVAEPSMHIPVWELGYALFQTLDVVHPTGSSFLKKSILAETASVRIASELNT